MQGDADLSWRLDDRFEAWSEQAECVKKIGEGTFGEVFTAPGPQGQGNGVSLPRALPAK